MRELSLFTGAGGGLLGSILLGWRTVAYVERDPYCQRVLQARIRDGAIDDAPIFDDVRRFDGKPWRGKVDVVTGGFPCQPHSQAGKRLGGLDDRDLWPDTVRILRESGAPLGFFENVSGLLTSRDADGLPMFGRILGDLSEAGFDAEWCVLGADDVGAPHRRKRLWILAYSQEQPARPGLCSREPACEWRGRPGDNGSPWWCDPADLEHAASGAGDGWPNEPRRGSQGRAVARRPSEGEPTGDDWLLEPYVGRVASRVAARVDRLRALGNGQVPQAMAAAFTYLAGEAGLLMAGRRRESEHDEENGA